MRKDSRGYETNQQNTSSVTEPNCHRRTHRAHRGRQLRQDGRRSSRTMPRTAYRLAAPSCHVFHAQTHRLVPGPNWRLLRQGARHGYPRSSKCRVGDGRLPDDGNVHRSHEEGDLPMTRCPRCNSPLEITLSGAEDQTTRSRTLMCVSCFWRKSSFVPNPNFRPIIMEPTKDQKHQRKIA